MAYWEFFWRPTAVELHHQIGFVVPLMDLKYAFFPFAGAHVQTGEADADSAAAGQFGHCNSHKSADGTRSTNLGALNTVEVEQMRPGSLTKPLTMERKRGGEKKGASVTNTTVQLCPFKNKTQSTTHVAKKKKKTMTF